MKAYVECPGCGELFELEKAKLSLTDPDAEEDELAEEDEFFEDTIIPVLVTQNTWNFL